MLILGINAYHGDASASIVKDGKLIASAEEERFNRQKHCAGFPALAIEYCLREAGAKIEDIDHIGISRNPKANLYKKLLFSLSRGPRIAKMLKDRLANVSKIKNLKDEIAEKLKIQKSSVKAKIHYIEHHSAHMASAFLVSPFDEASILSIDGFGDFVSTMTGKGEGNNIETLDKVIYPHSLGILYAATCQYIGFPKYGDEGKVMGLAPYGKPSYMKTFEDIIKLKDDGSFELNLDYFLHHSVGVDMTWDEGTPSIGKIYSEKFIEKMGPPREPGTEITQREKDIASSLQTMTENVIFHVLNHLHKKNSSDNICIAGGVALNSVANGMLFNRTPFKDAYIVPPAGDSGGSIGAAFYIHNCILGNERNYTMNTAYTGPQYSNDEILPILEKNNLKYRKLKDDELFKFTAEKMSDGKVIGWFQGRMEIGPRALGNRSIVVDPRRSDMKDILNARIKHREPFRPFAPSILEEKTSEYFEHDHPSPFMLMVYKFKEDKRSKVPAVCHVDDTGRLQTVSKKDNERYWRLIKEFENITGVPLILNTSFNENEPIVENPQQAIDCFLKTKMDMLVLGNYIIERD